MVRHFLFQLTTIRGTTVAAPSKEFNKWYSNPFCFCNSCHVCSIKDDLLDHSTKHAISKACIIFTSSFMFSKCFLKRISSPVSWVKLEAKAPVQNFISIILGKTYNKTHKLHILSTKNNKSQNMGNINILIKLNECWLEWRLRKKIFEIKWGKKWLKILKRQLCKKWSPWLWFKAK